MGGKGDGEEMQSADFDDEPFWRRTGEVKVDLKDFEIYFLFHYLSLAFEQLKCFQIIVEHALCIL